MKWNHRITAAVAGVMLLGLMAGSANADAWNKKTFFTLSRGVELPGGMVLSPGRYTFRLADTWDRHIVQVLTSDEKQLLASVMTITAPNRLDAAEKSELTFGESSPGVAPPVKYWYYPGEYAGREFLYPKSQLERIAANAHGSVEMTTAAITTDNMEGNQVAEAQVDVSEPTESVSANNQSSIDESSQSANNDTSIVEESTLAQNTTTSPDTDTRTYNSQNFQSRGPRPVGTSGSMNTLPKTASFDPLVGFIGLMSFGGFVATRVRPR